MEAADASREAEPAWSLLVCEPSLSGLTRRGAGLRGAAARIAAAAVWSSAESNMEKARLLLLLVALRPLSSGGTSGAGISSPSGRSGPDVVLVGFMTAFAAVAVAADETRRGGREAK